MLQTIKVNQSSSSDNQSAQELIETNQSLMTVRSVFPFQLFPDELHIQTHKIDITYRQFFLQKQVFSALIPDFKTARIEMGPFFASLIFELTGFEQNPHPISHLPRSQAQEAYDLILGLIAAQKHQVDLPSNRQQLISTLKDLSRNRS